MQLQVPEAVSLTTVMIYLLNPKSAFVSRWAWWQIGYNPLHKSLIQLDNAYMIEQNTSKYIVINWYAYKVKGGVVMMSFGSSGTF